MKLIIDIDEEVYKNIMNDHGVSPYGMVFNSIQNGTSIPDNIEDFSDGYHTFNQLYHQRAVLFATIVNLNKNISWKSWKHEDGKYCFDSNGEWFIVGIDTPQGSYTYHYEKAYWDMFKCQELSNGKHWDGHTEDDVIRLLSLVSSVHISENATNGDVIKAMFPNIEAKTYGLITSVKGLDCDKGALNPYRQFWGEWWNAPYQKGDSNEIS